MEVLVFLDCENLKLVKINQIYKEPTLLINWFGWLACSESAIVNKLFFSTHFSIAS